MKARRIINIIAALVMAVALLPFVPQLVTEVRADAPVYEDINYVDADGNTQTANCRILTSSDEYINCEQGQTEAWWAVTEDVTINSKVLLVGGKVNLILCDDATLHVKVVDIIDDPTTFNIWCQEHGTGKIVTNEPQGVLVSGSLVLNGGNITHNEYEGSCCVYIHDSGTFTMNGGTVEGEDGYGVNIPGSGTFIMNGGTVIGDEGAILGPVINNSPGTGWGYTGGINGDAIKVSTTARELSYLEVQIIRANYEIKASADPQAGGSVTGAGTYKAGQTVTLKATPSSGHYSFVNWTENGEVVKDENNNPVGKDYSFIASSDRDLVANFQPDRLYTVKFVNENGTQLQSSELLPGVTPEYTGKTPAKDADNDYHYTFSGWTPEIGPVEDDVTYTAAFKAEAHSFDYKTTKPATCTEAGEKQGTCSKCKYVKTEEIPATGHDWKDATCTEPKTCTVCGATEGDPLGHKWGEWNQTKAPTETEAGEEERVCENDPSHKETREVPPSGHTHKLTLVPAIPAKRDTPGNKAYYTCSGCDKWFWDAEGKEEITDKEEVYVYWFPDVTAETVNATSLESIYWAAANSIVNGFKDGLFRPEDNCTREQFAIMLWRFAGQPAADLKSAEKFSDLGSFSNSTAKKAVAWAAEKGIVKGFEDGTFRPDKDITRAQVAVMVWRFAGEPAAKGSSSFSDIGTYTENVQKAVVWAETSELVKGYSDGTFKPAEGCQRQHMAIILNRFNSNIKKYK